MTSIRRFAVTLLAGSAILCAQDQPPGGWRRVPDAPPAPPAPEANAPAQYPNQDPTQPVERTPVDEWGNEEIAIDGFHHVVYAIATWKAYQYLMKRL